MSRRTDQDLVEELCEIEYGLNDWELKFVVDLAKKILHEKMPLTPPQRHKAEQIIEDKGSS